MPDIEVTDISYHRNGISGLGFHAVLFKDGRLNMMAAVFDEPGSVAVFDTDLVGAGVIAFGFNSWRGDSFEAQLREAIQRHQDSWDNATASWTWPVKP